MLGAQRQVHRVITGERLLHQRLGPGEELIRFLKTPLTTYGMRKQGQHVPGARRIAAENALLNLQGASKCDLGCSEVSRPDLIISEPRQGIQASDLLDADEFPGGSHEGLGAADRGRDLARRPAGLLDPPLPLEDFIGRLDKAEVRGEGLEGVRPCAGGRRGNHDRPPAVLGLALPQCGRCPVA
jgi:hypothetical protein